MTYFIATALVWGFLYALYHHHLRRETFYRANRLYLLLSLFAGLLLPLLPALYLSYAEEPTFFSVWMAPVSVTRTAWEGILENDSHHVPKDWFFLVWIAYGIGMGINGFRFVSGCLHLLKTIRVHGWIRDEHHLCIVPVPGLATPFSFFNYLFWDPSVYETEQERRIIYEHETAHIRQWHSADVFLMELLTVFFWFNPLIYRYKHALRTLHELLADEAALRLTNTQYYGHLLIGQLQSGPVPALANHFFYSQLKERISKMTQPKSHLRHSWKYALSLPVVMVLIVVLYAMQLTAQSTTGYYASAPTPSSFTSLDTVITFDPTTLQETMQVVENKITGKPDVMPRYIGNGNCEDLALAERDACAQKTFTEDVQQTLNKYLPENLKNGRIKGKILFKARISNGRMALYSDPVQGISKEVNMEVYRALNKMDGKWVNAKVKKQDVIVEILIPIVF